MASKDDFQRLIDAALPFAKEMLEREGEFIPFGARLAPNGEVALVAGDVGKEHPKSDEVIRLLTESFASEDQSQIAAAAVCFMASTTSLGENSQAVAVFKMSHVNGATIDVYLPYDLGGPAKVSFRPLVASRGQRNFLVRHLH